MTEITLSPIDHNAVTERVRSNQAGAVCVFLGTVREMTSGRKTASLDYEEYPGMALKKMAEIEDEARRKWPIIEAALVHRVGHLELGEVSVVVAVSCPHREQSFEACKWLIDTLIACRDQFEAALDLGSLGIRTREYAVLTLHRPANVDDPATFRGLLRAIGEVQRELPVIFPVHPRTRHEVIPTRLGHG